MFTSLSSFSESQQMPCDTSPPLTKSDLPDPQVPE